MNPSCADANLGAIAIPESVREPGTRVDKRARRIDATAKRRRKKIGFGHDRIRVVRAVHVDELDSGFKGWQRDHGKGQASVLGVVRRGFSGLYERVELFWSWRDRA